MRLNRNTIANLPANLQPYAYHFQINNSIIDLINKGLIDRSMFEFDINVNGETVILTKGTNFKFNQNSMTVITPLGIKLTIPYSVFNNLSYNHIVNIISGYFICKVVKRDIKTKFGVKSDYVVTKLKSVARMIDVNEAQQLIDSSNPVRALLDILGYEYDKRIAYLSIVRMFPVVANCHICQLTLTNTGKTYFSLRLSDSLNYYYSTTSISEAKLIYNAVNNTYGIVFNKNGVIIDEILTVKELKNMEENLLSGMENGVWTKSSGKVINLPVRKIPFIFFGNIPGKTLSNGNSRQIFGDLLKSELRLRNVNAFLDRIAIIDIFTEPVSSNTLIKDYCYSNSTLAGWVEIIRKRYQSILNSISFSIDNVPAEITVGNYRLSTGRIIRYAKMLKAYLIAVLGNDVVPNDYDLFNCICGDSLYNILNLAPLLEDSSKSDSNDNDDSNNNDKYDCLLDTEKKILDTIKDYGGQIDIDTLTQELNVSKGTIYNTLYSLENKGMVTLEGKTVRLIQ